MKKLDSEEEALVYGYLQEEEASMSEFIESPEEPEDALDSTNSPSLPQTQLSSNTARNEVIYALAAGGMKYSDIARELGVVPSTITVAMKSPIAPARVAFHQERLFGKSVRKRMDSLAHKAVDNLGLFLDAEDQKIKSKATLYVLDQAVGKAKQTFQHEGSLIGDLIDRINNARDVSGTGADYAQPKDDLESFIDAFVPEHTVGVRKREEK